MKSRSSVPGHCRADRAPKTHSASFLGDEGDHGYVQFPLPRPQKHPGLRACQQTFPCASQHRQPLWAQIRHPGTNPTPGLTPSIPLMPASTVLGRVPEAASRALNNSGLCNGIMNSLTTPCGLGTYISRNTDSPGLLGRLETYTCQETLASARLVGFKTDRVETLPWSHWPFHCLCRWRVWEPGLPGWSFGVRRK